MSWSPQLILHNYKPGPGPDPNRDPAHAPPLTWAGLLANTDLTVATVIACTMGRFGEVFTGEGWGRGVLTALYVVLAFVYGEMWLL